MFVIASGCLRPFSLRTLAGVFSLFALALVAQPVIAQAHPNVAPDQIRQIQTVEPKSGPPGTWVEVATENLPLQARIHVGVGARHIGFEALTETQQGVWGDVSARVQVPDYWTWDRPMVFIFFNGIFSPIGLSDPFHVTNEDGWVRRTGRIADEGGTCLGFRDQDDYFYALQGSVEGLDPGAEVVLDGVMVEGGSCGAANTLDVRAVREAG